MSTETAEIPVSPKANGRGQGALRVYRALREEILRLEIPPGEVLDEVRIGRQFNLSRSPVREALIRLGSEGLVTTLPNKSTMVTPLRVEEFPDYIDALDLLQRATTRLAAEHRLDADLIDIRAEQQAFEDAVAERDVLAMIQANRDFHVRIAQASGNRYLTGQVARLMDEGRRFLRLYFRSFDDTMPPSLNEEHYQIIASIETRDADLAERLAHEHTNQVSARFLAYMSRRRTSGISVTAR
jgi:DNA-binding GntR family transcriptional regulator